MIYLKVQKVDAEIMRIKLLRESLLHPNYDIFSSGNYVYFPLKSYIKTNYEIVNIEGKIRKKKYTPYDKILELLNIDDSTKMNIPSYWEKFGNVVLIKMNDCPENYKKKIGEAFAKVLNAKSVLLYNGVKGEFREPIVEFIYGNDPITTHIENGIFYRFDASKIMFSSGNVDERIRMSKIDCVDETVIDMFAGIGYFSLPIAKYCFPKKVIAIEKNEYSFKFLLENKKINNVEMDTILSDNRELNLKDAGDRIIMGYIHTREFIPYAIKMLKHKGILHYHDTWRKEEVLESEEIIKQLFGDYYYQILRFHVVKNYAPKIFHISLDIKIRKV